jgi:hypothetical protein
VSVYLNEENKDERHTGIIVRSAIAFTFPWIETVCGATLRDACSLTTLYRRSFVCAKRTYEVGFLMSANKIRFCATSKNRT